MATTGPAPSTSMKANVMFKRGTQSSFNNLSTYQDGCFYLTTDSHRLYIGTGDNKANLVSQSVITYPNWASIEALSNSSSSSYAPGLCSEGQFYYAKAENILCTYSNGKWIQINPDHNDDHDTYVKSVSVAKNTADTVNGKKLVYDVKITQAQKNLKGNTEGAPTEVSGKLTISAADLDQIATNTNVGMEAEKSDSKVYLKNSGTGANAAKKVELAGGGSVSVSTDSSNKITISGIDTTYSLNTTTNTTGAKVNLQNQNGLPAGSFAVEVDDKALTVESNTPGENGFIKLAHEKPLTQNASYTPTDATKDAYGNVTLLMPAVSVNEYGHVTAVGTQNIALPRDKNIKVSSVSADNSGKITIKIKDENTGIEKDPAVSGQDLYHVITVDGTKKTVYNQGDLGAFYSSAEVDTLITNAKSEMNAMTYCGTTTNSKFGQIKGPQKGDTYKAAEKFTIGSGSSVVNVNTGDLIIYNGADVAAGLAGDITKWEVVPSGDDIDTTYKMQLDETTIKLINQVNNNIAGQVAVKGTNGISVTNSGGLSIGHANTITAGSVAGEKSEDNRSFSIPTIQYDGYGHITKAGTTTIDFPVDKDTTYTFGSNAANKEVSLKNSNGVATGSLRFTSTDNSFAVSMTNAHTDQPVVDLKLATVRQNDSSATNVSYSPLSGGNAQTFTVAKANVDAYGRVTGFVNQAITLNTDLLTYNVSTNVDSNENTLSVESSLTRNNTIAQSKFVKVKSDSLTFSNAEDAEDTVSVDLVWGTF